MSIDMKIMNKALANQIQQYMQRVKRGEYFGLIPEICLV